MPQLSLLVHVPAQRGRQTARLIADVPGFLVAVAIENEGRTELLIWSSPLVREADKFYEPVKRELARIGAVSIEETVITDEPDFWYFGEAKMTKYVATS